MKVLNRAISCTVLCLVAVGCTTTATEEGTEPMMEIHPRSRVAVEGGDGEHVSETAQTWDARETAIIVCDMWDDHWCQGAAKRVGELAVPLNRVLENARERGVLVIHSPSTTVSPYEGTPARRRATSAPHVATPAPLSTADRWGTKWCWPDPKKESDLPIDDSDMGCDCEAKCEIRDAWSRQIDLIRIDERDAVSDDGQEVFNVLEERGVENVVLLGVHLNMCVLGRPFGIRQMVNLGKNVVLMRDMTDTMYNSEKKPFVDHFRGTDLVVEHVERHWCPTITSVDFVGGDPFRFREDPVKTSN